LDFAKMIVNQVMGTPDVPVKPVQTEAPAAAPAQSPPAAQSAPAPARQAAPSPPQAPVQTPAQAPVQTMPPPQAAYPAQPYPPQAYGAPPLYPGYPPVYPGYENSGVPESVLKQEVNVQTPQFPRFAPPPSGVLAAPVNGTNLDLIMNVPLAVSIEIGKTKKKIREIMDFAQGTVIELEKQAGAPVDIVVNGQLIARGDVVVIDDNFGVRVTEIIGTKELVSTLENNA
ncbi:MAG: flagellar motor switch protein FliN, partial [Oscillospiraceae bacterium]|nr:flagellar motor switch protein FliN [Oscillospiraceae bacterium]